jgi:hypothetical protein
VGSSYIGVVEGGYPKIRMRSPSTRERNSQTFRNTDDVRGDKESRKDCSCFKSCEPFYTCPRAPFYRETKGLLHSETNHIVLACLCRHLNSENEESSLHLQQRLSLGILTDSPSSHPCDLGRV